MTEGKPGKSESASKSASASTEQSGGKLPFRMMTYLTQMFTCLDNVFTPEFAAKFTT